jgi:hypothetical protein
VRSGGGTKLSRMCWRACLGARTRRGRRRRWRWRWLCRIVDRYVHFRWTGCFARRFTADKQDLDWKTHFAPTFKHTPLLVSSNLVMLARILKENGGDDEEAGASSASTGSWKPQLHFVWSIILESYFPKGDAQSTGEKAPFQDFFRVVVDGQSHALAPGS